MPQHPHPRHCRGLAEALVLVPLLLIGAGLAVVKSHSHRVYGGYVQRVDPAPFAVAREHFAITGVSVLDPAGDEMLPDRTVVVDRGRIVSVARASDVPADARVIDGRGRYLVPGLVDAHVHLRKQPNDLLLYIANGVTHVRDLAGSEADLALREALRGERIGPRLTVASPLLFSGGPVKSRWEAFVSPRMSAGAAADAEALVASLIDAGYDAIKTYADLDLDTYRAINRAAAARGLHTVGHLPDGFDLAELATTHQRELAHVEELIKGLQREFRTLARDDYSTAFPGFVMARADAIIDDLLANDITVNSTLWLADVVGDQVFDLPDALRRIELEYANPAMVEGSPYVAAMGWLPETNMFVAPADTSADEEARIRGLWAAREAAHRVLCRRMVERGVRITAGTDATSHLAIAGFSLHDELASLVECGMTPADALRAATSVPAALMHSEAGSIAPGRRADLILLSANPLEDIRHTRRIEAVVADGRYLDRATLDKLLAAVREAHAASRKFDLSAYQ